MTSNETELMSRLVIRQAEMINALRDTLRTAADWYEERYPDGETAWYLDARRLTEDGPSDAEYQEALREAVRHGPGSS